MAVGRELFKGIPLGLSYHDVCTLLARELVWILSVAVSDHVLEHQKNDQRPMDLPKPLQDSPSLILLPGLHNTLPYSIKGTVIMFEVP